MCVAVGRDGPIAFQSNQPKSLDWGKTMIASGIFQDLESNVQSYARGFPRLFEKALGAEIWDVDG